MRIWGAVGTGKAESQVCQGRKATQQRPQTLALIYRESNTLIGCELGWKDIRVDEVDAEEIKIVVD
jgi:hypothetical protein